MIDLDRLQAMSDEQLADELDSMIDRAIEIKAKGAPELVEICGLVPLLTRRLRQHGDLVSIRRLEQDPVNCGNSSILQVRVGRT